jgi:hypothetical protein
MHAIQLVDLAAVLAFHGPALLFRRELVSEEAMQAYWLASRARFDQWHRLLADYRHFEEHHEADNLSLWWQNNEPMIDEVLLSEPLVRVYAAISAHLDGIRNGQEISPITHAVYLSHLEVRNRVLQLLLTSRVIPLVAAVRINSLRTLIERWSDALLGHLHADSAKENDFYSVDVNRMRAFSEDARLLPTGTARATAGWLLCAAMRDSLLRRANSKHLCANENRAVADAVLLCLRPDLFDSVGMMKSLWLHRLERGAEQTDRVLDQLALADITAGDILGGYETIRESSFGRW